MFGPGVCDGPWPLGRGLVAGRGEGGGVISL
jgi:hypothetical protein